MRIACLDLALIGSGCAPTLQPGRINTADTGQAGVPRVDMAHMAEMQKMVAQGQEARTAAEAFCAPFLKRETGWAEERAVGQLLAVELAAKHGHFLLDGAHPQKPTEELQVRRPITLPDTGKNATSAHVAIVGKNLARYSSRPDLPWVFGVIENEAPSTLNAPGGYVFVTTGLLKKMSNEAQLAGVLAHEIGHVTRKHALLKYVDAKHKQCVAAKYAAWMVEHSGTRSPATDEMARFARKFEAASLDLDAAEGDFVHFMMQVTMMLVMSGNEKEAEFKTDQTALELVSFAGYDPTEYEKFLLANPQPLHPSGEERAAKLGALREGPLKDFARGTAKPDLSKQLEPLGK